MNTWQLNSVQLGAGVQSALSPLSMSQVISITGSVTIHAYRAIESATSCTVSSAVQLSNKVWLALTGACTVGGAVLTNMLSPIPLATSYLVQASGEVLVAARRAMAAAQTMLVSASVEVYRRMAFADSESCTVSTSCVISKTTYSDANEERTMRISFEDRVMIVPGER